MTRKERLNAAYRHLIGLNLVSSQLDVAEKMCANQSSVSSAFNGNERSLTDRFLTRFNNAFGNIFNLSWLKTGEGEMLKSAAIDIDIDLKFGSNGQLAFGDITNIGDAKAQIIILQERIKTLNDKLKDKDESYKESLLAKDNEIANLNARIKDLQEFNQYLKESNQK